MGKMLWFYHNCGLKITRQEHISTYYMGDSGKNRDCSAELYEMFTFSRICSFISVGHRCMLYQNNFLSIFIFRDLFSHFFFSVTAATKTNIQVEKTRYPENWVESTKPVASRFRKSFKTQVSIKRPVVGSCECGNEPSCSIKSGEYLTLWTTTDFFKTFSILRIITYLQCSRWFSAKIWRKNHRNVRFEDSNSHEC